MARAVITHAWCVSFEPVPATTVAPSGFSWTASSISRRCSSSARVGASPVVPQTTTPSEPCAQRWRSNSTNASSSTRRSSSNGVTIAVRMAPRSAMRGTVSARSARYRRALVPELTVEVTAVRYALEEGDFAVLAGVSDDGEEVVLTGALAPRPRGRVRRRLGRLAPPSAPRAAVRGRARPGAASRRRGRGARLPELDQARRASAAPRGSSTATAPRASSTPSTATRTARCARSRGSASGRSARRCARGRSRARCGRCGCSSRATASRPPPRRASTARSAPARSRCCRPTRTRRPRSRGSASPRPTRWPARSARRPTRRRGSTPGCSTRSTRPRATATATSRARSSSPARGGCSGPTPRTASTSSPPPGSSSRRTAASRTR